MSTINVQCVDQRMEITLSPLIASGGVEEDNVQFTFCNRWAGYAKTAIFYKNRANCFFVALDQYDNCIIPHEVTDEAGIFYFAVFGINTNGVRRTSEVLKYRVVDGAINPDTELPPDPTENEYEQMIEIYAEILYMFDNAAEGGWIESIKEQNSGNPMKVWSGTEAEYALVSPVDANTIYIITDDTTLDDIQDDIDEINAALPAKAYLTFTAMTDTEVTFTVGSLLTIRQFESAGILDTHDEYDGLFADATGENFAITTNPAWGSYPLSVPGTWRVIGKTGREAITTPGSDTEYLAYYLLQRVE